MAANHVPSPFANLSAKQLEVLELLADDLSAKEVAINLGISESAVVQRIEAVRRVFDGLPRRAIVRQFREFRSVVPDDATCKKVACKTFQLPVFPADPDELKRDATAEQFELADAAPLMMRAPWEGLTRPVVPEVLDGDHAVRNRLLAAMAIAVGMLIVIVLGLAAANAVADLV